ncbi:MAG: helix-turn-helix transcriptional regulator [Lachnospiraceae bacterium]|nr:helix-turn-helix transcriptional regulator [Lachnospiraceae bacterium]
MNFQEQLDAYMEKLHCTGRELASESGVSETIISRYRKGERVPAADSTYLLRLAEGIAQLAAKRGLADMEETQIWNGLKESLPKGEPPVFPYERLDVLLRELDVNLAQLAAFLHYDVSYLSKIRTGKRRPANPEVFMEKVCIYVVKNSPWTEIQPRIAALTGRVDACSEIGAAIRLLEQWLYQEAGKREDYVSGFLHKVDDFDLDDYIRAIHFDSLRVPKVPFTLPVSRHYYGLSEMREGELDFLKHTVLARSMEPVYLCSDMPVEDMAADEAFAKKYMFGLAMVLKKGLHIHIIHDVERPLKDMMLGLENWVPLYMTGQISPYYLKGSQNRVYAHLHYASGQAAMTGDCISGHHELAHYYLTSRREEVAICRKNLQFLLKKAHPLMEIYRRERRKGLEAFLAKDAALEGKRRRILAAPPLFPVAETQLVSILERAGVAKKRQTQILEYQKRERQQMEQIFTHSLVEDELAELSEAEYEVYPSVLPLAECFFEQDIRLTYAEYRACIKSAQDYALRQEQYRFRLTKAAGFHNIQILCREGQWCMVSKNRAPAIHFVIHHPKLREALENLVLPIRDEGELGGVL